jgi:hypothetical protein
MWFWFDRSSDSWIPVSELDKIEEEYQQHLSGKRRGQLVYHCFGNGWTAIINFNNMTTSCGSGRCMATHERNGLDNDHMSYQLKRE